MGKKNSKIQKDLLEYKYKNRKAHYYEEKYEISPEELNKLNSIKTTPVSFVEIPKKNFPVKILIDTDLGTDLDDALAVLYALNLSEIIEIIGITTNYGPSNLRAEIVKKICNQYWKKYPESKKFEIHAGASKSLGTHQKVFLAGNEGVGIFPIEKLNELFNEWKNNLNKYNFSDIKSTSEFIYKSINENPGLTLVSIGIPSNIGYTLKIYPEISEKINELVIMGCGSFFLEKNRLQIGHYSPTPSDWIKSDDDYYNSDKDYKKLTFDLPKDKNEAIEFIKNGKPIILYPNHNLIGDTLASKIIFDDNKLNIRIISHEVTSKFWLEGEAIEYLKKVAEVSENSTAAGIVGELLKQWFYRRNGNGNGQCPHDPLTIHESVFGGEDSNVLYVPGTIILHEWAAYSTFLPNKDGKHLLGVDVKNEKSFLKHLTKYIIKE
jgi:inosine-uridine nucleoside N-ribohydrolase